MDTAHRDSNCSGSANAAKFRRRFSLHVHKNLLAISTALLAVYTAVFPLTTMQSSLHPEGGLGTVSLSVRTAAAMFQALFLNALAVRRLGLKRAMLVGIALEMVYIAGNTYARWFTLVPAAFVSGFGYALLRTAESTYVARLAAVYAAQMDLMPDATKSRFFAVYYVFYCSSRVFGYVTASLIFGEGVGRFALPGAAAVAANVSGCGADFCAAQRFNNASQVGLALVPRSGDIYYLCAFCLVCQLAAFALMAVALDDLERVSATRYGVCVVMPRLHEAVPHGWKDLLATISTWRNPKQLLLLPLCVYNGIDNAFWESDFTEAFVTCVYGIRWVGFVVSCYGLMAPVVIVVLALVSRVVCRPVPFLVSTLCGVLTAVALVSWTPARGGLPALFAVSAAWGVGSGLLPVCLVAYHGILFEDNLEGAFSTYWLCNSLGATLSYAWSYSLCMSSKIAFAIGLVIAGFLGYLCTEMIVFVEKVKRDRDCHLAAI